MFFCVADADALQVSFDAMEFLETFRCASDVVIGSVCLRSWGRVGWNLVGERTPSGMRCIACSRNGFRLKLVLVSHGL